MIKKYKWQLLAASLVTLLSSVVGIFAATDQLGGEAFQWVIIGLPVLLLALLWAGVWLTAKDPKGNEQNDKVMGVVIWTIPALSLLVSGEFLALSRGNESVLNYIFPLVIGVLFIFIGNYLPKCKQSFTMGIKLTWTLANEENWYVTHRFAGKLWFIGGLVILPLAFLPLMAMLFVMLGIVVLMVVPPVIYSWRYYKKQVEAGTADPNPKIFSNKKEKRMGIGGLIAVGIVLVGVFVLIFTAKFEVVYGETSFTVDSSAAGSVTVEYADIESVEYLETGMKSQRVMGFGDYPLQMGTFRNGELGSHSRYTYTACEAVVVVKYDGKYLVINGKTAEETKAIYDTLNTK
jgi:uncharacterized membrane protein